MRISDWSSDVCSSDLCSGRPDHCPAVRAPPPRTGYGPACREKGWPALPQSARPAARAALMEVKPPAGLRQLRADGRVAKIGRATSELQSLMRISYAVFCLKKKKTKTRHNTKI